MTVTLPYTVANAVDTVSSGKLDSGAIQLARDLLAGYNGDYFFYQSGNHTYNLLLSSPDSIVYSSLDSSTSYSFDSGFYFYEIDASPRSHTEQYPVSVQGGGTFSGPFNYGSHEGTYSGNFTVTVQDAPVYISQYRYDDDGVTISNAGYVVFSSFDGFPHLIEGSSYYAYAQIIVILCIVFFALCGRIFKHVS